MGGTPTGMCSSWFPGNTYWLAVSQTVIVVVLFLIIIPIGTRSYYLKLNLFHLWEHNINRLSLTAREKFHVARMEINTLRPECIYFGPFRQIDNFEKTEYLSSVFNWILNLVMFLIVKPNIKGFCL